MRKFNWRDRLIKQFYGFNGGLDEYQRQVLDRIGQNAFLSLIGYVLSSSIVMGLLTAWIGGTTIVFIWLMANLVVVNLILGYIAQTVARLKLTQLEVPTADYHRVLRQTAKRCGWQTLRMLIYVQVMMPLLSVAFDHQRYWQAFMSTRQLKTLLLFTIVGGGGPLLIRLRRIKKGD